MIFVKCTATNTLHYYFVAASLEVVIADTCEGVNPHNLTCIKHEEVTREFVERVGFHYLEESIDAVLNGATSSILQTPRNFCG